MDKEKSRADCAVVQAEVRNNEIINTNKVVTDSNKEAESDEEQERKKQFDLAALADLLKGKTDANSDSNIVTTNLSQDHSCLFSVERPTGLRTSVQNVRPAVSGFTASSEEKKLSKEDKKRLEYLQELKVKFLRLVQRVGCTADDSLAVQTLYKLEDLAGRPSVPAYSLDNAKETAKKPEAEATDDLNFSLNILVIGKTGVGKSATVNSIFGDEVVKINAFKPESTSVAVISGIVDGIKIRVIDTPGLRPSANEQGYNCKVLDSVKKFMKKFSPDIMLYVDRLDSQSQMRESNDLPMLKTITSSLVLQFGGI